MNELNCVNHQEKLISFKNKISLLKAGLYLKIKTIKSQAVIIKKESVAAIVLISECYCLNFKKLKRL